MAATTTSSSRCAAVLVVLALGLARAGTAQAQAPSAQELETARDLFKEGKELRTAGDLKGAVEKLRAAHALGKTAVTGIELARTYVLVGKLVDAREIALSIARLPVAFDETDRSVEARHDAVKLAEELRPRIATLLVTGKGIRVDDVVHVTIDGAALPEAAVREPQKVDPGKHEISIRVGDGPAEREAHASAELGEGQTVEVVLELPPPPAPVVLPPPPPPPKPALPLLGKIGFGVGIAGVAVGTFAGVTALLFKGRLGSECDGNQCPSSTGGAGDLNSAFTWATVSTVSFSVAAAGGVLGLFEILGNGRKPDGGVVHAWVTPAGAGVDGRF
jgi:hypothetical protein